MKIFPSVFLVLLVLSACTNNAQKESVPPMRELLQQLTEQNGRACVRTSEIRGYGASNNRVITIDGGRDYYLATTVHACNDIDTSFRALFVGRFGEICGNSFSKIVTGGSRCAIGSVYRFNSRKEAFAALETASDLRREVIDRNKAAANDK